MPFKVRGHVCPDLPKAVEKAEELAKKLGGEGFDGRPIHSLTVDIYDSDRKVHVGVVTVDSEGITLHKHKNWPKEPKAVKVESE